MTVRAVVFDLYGTLIAPFPGGEGRADIPGMARELGLDPRALKRGWSAVRTRDLGLNGGVEGDIREVLNGMGVAVDAASLRRAAEVRTDFIRETMRLRPDAVPTLERLAASGLRMALVSNCSVEVPPAFAETPLAPFFDPLVFSSDVHVKKPDPAIFRRALDGLGLDGADCAYVGDGHGTELTGATAVGMRAIHLSVPGEPVEAIPEYEGASWTGERVSALSELPRRLGLEHPGDG
jgi:putative hydrolase of the HAD superfamily